VRFWSFGYFGYTKLKNSKLVKIFKKFSHLLLSIKKLSVNTRENYFGIILKAKVGSKRHGWNLV
jgi:hypothetical protein